MIAASARTSGTTLPVSSNLKRGSSASRRAAACSAARDLAARTRRLCTVDRVVVALAVTAEAFAVVVDFLTVGLRVVEVAAVFRVVVVRVAALDSAGTPTAEIAVRTQISRAAAANRARITGKPL